MQSTGLACRTLPEVDAGLDEKMFEPISGLGDSGIIGSLATEQFVCAYESCVDVGRGHRAEVTDLHSPLGQNVEEKATDELMRMATKGPAFRDPLWRRAVGLSAARWAQAPPSNRR
jgi:hypothetical protein